MKFEVSKVSNWRAPPVEVEINSLEELLAFYEENNQYDLIISFNPPTIALYDDYVE